MNIFLLSEQYCPIESAQMQCDAHVQKMAIESCQLLQTCFDLSRLAQSDCPKTQSGNPRKHFNPKHPCSIWVRKSTSNMDWLILHAMEQFQEFKRRFKKSHFTESFLDWVIDNVGDAIVPKGELTDFPIAINADSECRKILNFDNFSVFEKYRAFYIYDKPFAKWEKGRSKPDWYNV